MRRATGGRDDDFHASSFGRGDKLGGGRRGAMSGEYSFFVRHTELSEDVAAVLHDVPIGLTAHDDGYHLLPLSQREPGLTVVVAQIDCHPDGEFLSLIHI